MFELDAPVPPHAQAVPMPGALHAGGMAALPQRWLVGMLDEVDYGMLLVTADQRLIHANATARRVLGAGHPLHLQQQLLRAAQHHDAAKLQAALQDAAQRGRRCLLHLGSGALASSLAVVPLDAADDGARPVLLMLGKHKVCEELSVENFARSRHLTLAETQVLKSLSAGLQPLDIARRNGVELCTVRSQIRSIRQKTGSHNLRAQLTQLARLPPMVNALHGVCAQPLAA
ncbi:DNA-binding protein with HTH domain [Burkholderiales bacterium JOSHI_001]|nr:DNA-binding protein with HTH domain [Burkholderiales bacterium JOSHI_001]